MPEIVLEARDLNVSYVRRRRRDNRVVKDVSFTIDSGQTLALVGESGSGKTTVARAVVGLVRAEGQLLFGSAGEPLQTRRTRALRRQIPMVFQDPRSSLNPRMLVGDVLNEGWAVHPEVAPAGDRRQALVTLLERVGLTEGLLSSRPAQLSGGQCQRVSIARAIALRPRLLVCDEAVSALDVSVQAQILHLLIDLKAELEIALLFITHDLGVVRQIADSVAVMEDGRIVEQGPTEQVFTAPSHPYSQDLLDAALDLAPADGPGRAGSQELSEQRSAETPRQHRSRRPRFNEE
ncbi:MAG: ATP-binding cassette domain-containing protein [Bifidobacteriaceae bacterium]|jgi:peptide/nickel transport system ATP-binding protein/oligopeptide transport system ATP-binding protein|nr:ATP-binding cassette domain-containing protein [Bifidobacteriaceae bacterium]